MIWWYWMVLGLLLVGLEVATPGGFYLLFFGLSALLVGTAAGVGLVAADWMQWLLFSVFAIVSLFLFRAPLARAMQHHVGEPAIDTLVGEQAIVLAPIAAGGVGKVELRGSTWNACNGGTTILTQNQRCRVDRVDGLTLWVTAA